MVGKFYLHALPRNKKLSNIAENERFAIKKIVIICKLPGKRYENLLADKNFEKEYFWGNCRGSGLVLKDVIPMFFYSFPKDSRIFQGSNQ